MSDQSDADYQEEWEQLDEKVLLASLLAEQQRTNQLLAQLTDTDSKDVDKEATPFVGTRFGRASASGTQRANTTHRRVGGGTCLNAWGRPNA